MKEEVHIGQMINAKLKEQGRSVRWLADQIHCTPANVYKIMKNSIVNIDILLSISKAMDYNFLCYYCAPINKEISTIPREKCSQERCVMCR